MSGGYFIAGTDTGVGKTRISLGLMRLLQARGLSVLAMKPVASGCERTDGGLRNDDALKLQAQSSMQLPYASVNPYAFEPAIAPHLAAESAGVGIDIDHIESVFRSLPAGVDCRLVEGVGGWLVPVNRRQSMADVARALGLPVILVVGIRLGCLNHALLSAAAIRDAGLPLAGWVANRIDRDCEFQQQNIDALRQRIGAPLLADIPWLEQEQESADWARFALAPPFRAG